MLTLQDLFDFAAVAKALRNKPTAVIEFDNETFGSVIAGLLQSEMLKRDMLVSVSDIGLMDCRYMVTRCDSTGYVIDPHLNGVHEDNLDARYC